MPASPPVPVRDAATVMLVRDDPVGAAGLEVFMLRRNLASAWVGGAYVFPGGAVDAEDREADLEPLCEGRTDAGCSAVLGIDRGGLAYWVAAVRECFEEAGVLLARRRGEEHAISFADPEVAARFEEHRAAVNAGTRRLVDVVAEEDLVLDVGAMHYVAHWITPEGEPRRYDTRFFVAAAPPGQVPLHDDVEVVAHEWVRPSDGLERERRRELLMLPPTVKNLDTLARFQGAADVLAHAAALAEVVAIQPTVSFEEGPEGEQVRVRLPGEIQRHW